MKILKMHSDIEIDYVAMFMSVTRLICDTHKHCHIINLVTLINDIGFLNTQNKRYLYHRRQNKNGLFIQPVIFHSSYQAPYLF